MSMVNAFARDENGKIKRKQPCQTPGCNYPNWHICLVGKPDTTSQLLQKDAERRARGLSDAHREAISESQKQRWAKNRERDENMVQYYKDNIVGYRDVARAFDVADNTAFKVLKRAEAQGEISMRPRGKNIRHTG